MNGDDSQPCERCGRSEADIRRHYGCWGCKCDELLAAFNAAVNRMEAVSTGILVENRAKGVSQASHVRHMAGHLEQHAKKARAAIAKAEART